MLIDQLIIKRIYSNIIHSLIIYIPKVIHISINYLYIKSYLIFQQKYLKIFFKTPQLILDFSKKLKNLKMVLLKQKIL